MARRLLNHKLVTKLGAKLGKDEKPIGVAVSKLAAKLGISPQSALVILAKRNNIGTANYQKTLDVAHNAEIRDALSQKSIATQTANIGKARGKSAGMRRKKSEKFGILDSPKLYAKDVEKACGFWGVACVYLDLDNFKKLNKKYTEVIVDKDILPEFQKLIALAVNDIGFAYAEGGDEVLLLLPNATAEFAKMIVDHIRTALSEKTFVVNGKDKIKLKFSSGIACVAQGADRSNLKLDANKMKKKAKSKGKNRTCM